MSLTDESFEKGGHVATVNRRTIVPTINYGFIATTGSMGDRWYKTIADLFSDILSTRPGDLVFLQLTQRDPRPDKDNSLNKSDSPDNYLELLNSNESINIYDEADGFIGLFEIAGKPFFDKSIISVNNQAKIEGTIPIRVPIEPKKFYPIPVTENRAFNMEPVRKELWNPKFRKTLRSAKSLTSISPEESRLLTELIYKNNDFSFSIENEDYPENQDNVISIEERLHQEDSGDDVETIKDVTLDDIPIVDDEKFNVEKVLEAWLMENYDKDRNKLEEIFGPRDQIEWFTNYVPYGMAGSNIDALSYHVRDGIRYKISVVELKVGKKKVVDQVMNYSKWVSKYLANNDDYMVQPVAIANDFYEEDIRKAKNQTNSRKPKLVKYRIEDEEVVLEKITG